MTTEDKLARMTSINQQLRRQLEQCRREVVEECAKMCETHWPYPSDEKSGEWVLKPTPECITGTVGELYAKGLRGMIGE